MTLTQRLTRGGLILLVFGTAASLLPSNGGAAFGADTCPNANPTSGTGRHTLQTAGVIGAVGAGAALFSNPGGHILPHRRHIIAGAGKKKQTPADTQGTTTPTDTSSTVTPTAFHQSVYNSGGAIQ